MDKRIEIYLPRWVSVLYVGSAVVLIPWIIILAEYLPTRHLATHWDALWVGFDIMLLLTLVVTVYFAIKRKIWVIVSASALATMFVVDVWFDVLTSKPGREQRQAFVSGIIELALAVLTYRLVYHILHHSTEQKDLKVMIRRSHKH